VTSAFIVTPSPSWARWVGLALALALAGWVLGCVAGKMGNFVTVGRDFCTFFGGFFLPNFQCTK